GEDAYFTDDILCDIITTVKKEYPDCAITLSLGERSYESYKRLYDAGADRYLLRHETADKEHYARLHPENMSFDTRMSALDDLKKIGYQVGCGFMVGSPYQTSESLAKDLKFIEKFKPQMCGIGPFIPHKATPFASESAGSVDFTCYLLSIIRLISPKILLPATTALGSIEENGRERGILAGANVVMPNLSPYESRKKYELYNNKLFGSAESAQAIDDLRKRMNAIGYEVVVDRGDAK
ncbi:MAG: [FeFe] hydrogenase H-cluster radical SAM maturase HydE, partial [Clostridia bacterium]|nr:[FeFe] hydrogenase H-cluster radical SAM maturase HydE [Clostridia bacterium]